MQMRVVGMMSGTSYDAVDAAVVDLRLEGEELVAQPLGLVSVDMPEPLRESIAAVLPPHATTMEQVCRLDHDLGRLFGEVAARARDEVGGGSVDLVSSHGQTVYHWVQDGRARGDVQLGSPAWIARAARAAVVSDLRNADIAAGGQGAPLVSLLDELLILRGDPTRGSLNLGGIANVTVHPPAGLLAYDLGPAGALIDAAVVRVSGGTESFDRDGARAARGRVDPRLLERLLDEPFYGRPAPKSTGKELFHAGYLEDALAGGAPPSADDLVATVTELTATLVARACRDHGLAELVVAGGGVRNPVLMRRLADLAAPCAIRPVEDHGLPAQGKEAYAFAVLGYLTAHGLPGTVAGATGAPVGSVLGSLTPGPDGWRLPAQGAPSPTRMRVARS